MRSYACTGCSLYVHARGARGAPHTHALSLFHSYEHTHKDNCPHHRRLPLPFIPTLFPTRSHHAHTHTHTHSITAREHESHTRTDTYTCAILSRRLLRADKVGHFQMSIAHLLHCHRLGDGVEESIRGWCC